MSQPLFPVVEVPDFISEDSQYDTQYKRSMKWDPELGDFVRDGAHRIKECDGKEAFAIWCFKIAQTERYRCLAYPDSIGTEMERAMDNDDEKTVESMVERTITDAIMVNPRAENVRDFQFTWEGDQMHVTFKVKGSNWDEEIEVRPSRSPGTSHKTRSGTSFWLCENHSCRRNRDFIRNGILYGGNRNRPVD